MTEDAKQTYFENEALPLRRTLFALAYHLTRNVVDSEDLVQETYVRAYEKFHQFKRGTNLKAWLSRILHNLFISEYRRKQAKSYAEPIDMNELSFKDDRTTGALPELEVMLPGELAGHDDFLQSIDERLKHGLEEMSDTYRDAFLLNAIGGMRYREVAKALKIPLGTVMSRLHRAKTTMREAWVQAT